MRQSEDVAPGESPEVWRRIALRLFTDGVTVEVVRALQDAGVRPILLKGPVIVRWLYADDPEERAYGDVDLLVAPHSSAVARRVLEGLGFTSTQPVRLPGERPVHAEVFKRPDGGDIDLHVSLHDLEEVPPQRVWDVVAASAEPFPIGRTVVDAPGETVRTLHAVLHAQLYDPPWSHALEDLTRAIRKVDRGVWRDATALARSLGVERAMGSKLRLVPEGVALAEELGLPAELPQHVFAVREEESLSYAHSMGRFMDLRSWRERAAYSWAKLVPSPAFLRQWTPLARRGPVGLAAAYVARVVWVVAGLPVAVVAWAVLRVRARKAADRS